MSEFLKNSKEEQKPLSQGQRIVELIFGEYKESSMVVENESAKLAIIFARSDYILMEIKDDRSADLVRYDHKNGIIEMKKDIEYIKKALKDAGVPQSKISEIETILQKNSGTDKQPQDIKKLLRN